MTTTDPYLFTARNLRVPTADDVPRMASVSVLGFRDSEIFRFTRSLHDTFPDDSVASFAKLYRAQLRDPCTVVIVAEDKPVPDDPGHWASPADIPAMVIVGVASWRLPEAMKSDELVVQDVGMDDATEDRDLSPRRMASYIRAAKQTEQRYVFSIDMAPLTSRLPQASDPADHLPVTGFPGLQVSSRQSHL